MINVKKNMRKRNQFNETIKRAKGCVMSRRFGWNLVSQSVSV